jgi:hypothetical protein
VKPDASRLHWAANELKLKGRCPMPGMKGILRERHRALDWLIRDLNREWDVVTTGTET